MSDWLGSDSGKPLSPENVGDLDVDRLIVLANESGRELLAEDKLHQSPSVVEDGRILEVPDDESRPI